VLILILSLLTAAIIVINKANIKAESIIITITYLNNIISVIFILFIKRKDAALRSIPYKNKIT
jgi:uncharacterized DUF497 family protein